MKVLRIWGTIWRRTLMPPVHKISCRQIYCSFRSQSFESFHLTAISTWQMIHVIAIVVILGGCMIKYNLPLRGPWWHGNPKRLIKTCCWGGSATEVAPCFQKQPRGVPPQVNSWLISILILNHVLLSSFSAVYSTMIPQSSCKTGDLMVVQEWSKERPFVSWFHRAFHCLQGQLSKWEKWVAHSEVKSENILNIEINFLSKIVKFPVVPTNLEAFITGKTELESEASYPPSNWCHLTGCSFEVWYFEVHLGGSSLESASQQLPPGRCSALGQGFGRRLPNECLAQTTKEHFEQRIL